MALAIIIALASVAAGLAYSGLLWLQAEEDDEDEFEQWEADHEAEEDAKHCCGRY